MEYLLHTTLYIIEPIYIQHSHRKFISIHKYHMRISYIYMTSSKRHDISNNRHIEFSLNRSFRRTSKKRKHQSSTSLALVRGIHRPPDDSLHKRPVTGRCWWRQHGPSAFSVNSPLVTASSWRTIFRLVISRFVISVMVWDQFLSIPLHKENTILTTQNITIFQLKTTQIYSTMRLSQYSNNEDEQKGLNQRVKFVSRPPPLESLAASPSLPPQIIMELTENEAGGKWFNYIYMYYICTPDVTRLHNSSFAYYPISTTTRSTPGSPCRL